MAAAAILNLEKCQYEYLLINEDIFKFGGQIQINFKTS